MHKILYYVFAATLILDALLQYFISQLTQNPDLVRPFLYAQAGLPAGVLILVMSLRFGNISRSLSSQLSGVPAVYIAIFFTYFLLSTFVGLAVSENSVTPVMDFVRALSPLALFIALMLSLRLDGVREHQGIFDLFSLLFIYCYALSIAKIILLSGGTYYGGGAHQYLMPTIVLSFLIFLLASPKLRAQVRMKFVPRSFILLCCIFFVFVVLVALSLKREQWIIGLITIALTFLYTFRRRGSIVFFSIVSCFILGAYLFSVYIGWLDLFLTRFSYTFSGSAASDLDASSFERIAEAQGVIYSLGNSLGIFEYLLGHGNGAEYVLNPDFSSVKDSTGSAYGLFRHVHSMYFIILMRNGLIGIFLYLIPIFCMISYFFLRRRRHDGIGYSVLASLMIFSLTALVSGVPANSLYGSLMYGFALAMFFSLMGAKGNVAYSR